jgi:GDP-4-dehydro-6-deoxy-D-mannose reductase
VNRLLITGADGFVGRWLVRAARAAGMPVVAAIMPGSEAPAEWSSGPPGATGVQVVRADLLDDGDVQRLADLRPSGVVHLAAIASGAEARKNPDGALAVNAAATTLLAALLATTSKPRFLLVSTGEVYGPGHDDPIAESAPLRPNSPYGSSKASAELALGAMAERGALPVIIARPFPHTGPGQTTTYVLPAIASRLAEAKRSGATQVRVGNLSAVRDFLDVRDVVRAYLLLLERGVPGEAYNVASGVGRRLVDCFDLLARLIGVAVRAEQDAALLRSGDIPVLIGDATRLHQATGWSPEIPFERTLQDLVNAQAD